MRTRVTRRQLFRVGAIGVAAAAAGTAGGLLLNRGSSRRRLERLRVNKAGTGFAGTDSGRPFVAWGFNWGGPGAYSNLDVVSQRFAEMRALGANTVRIHLQFGDVMLAPTRTRAVALEHIAAIVSLAEQRGLYLDISGNEVWLPARAPAWYGGLSEGARWEAQAVYWGAVAEVCADSPAVFCYDLLSEPFVGDGLQPGDWYTGNFSGFYFGQRISLDLAGRIKDDVARAWAERLRSAIRAHDPDHLITVGLVSNPSVTGFSPAAVAPVLDFQSVHLYPHTGEAMQAIDTVRLFAALGKPVLVEEIYPLLGSTPTVEQTITGTRGSAAGWLGFYAGREPDTLRQPRNLGEAVQRDWLAMFKRRARELARTPIS